MTLRAVIFDVDGTLVDTEEAHRQSFNRAFMTYRLKWEWDPKLYSELLGVAGGKERITHFIDSLQIDLAEKDRLRSIIGPIHRAKNIIYSKYLEAGLISLRPGIERLFLEARAKSVRLAIASTTTPINVEALLTACLGRDALNWVDVVAAGDIVPNKKPAPDIYRHALAKLGLEASDCIAIEDSEIGVRAAKAAGLCTVAVPTQWTRSQNFSQADLVLRSLGDVYSPLDPIDAALIKGKWFGLQDAEVLLASRQRGILARSRQAQDD